MDFVCLACYTGSRVGEYGVSDKPAGLPPDGYLTLPYIVDMPVEWRRRPIPLIAEDVELFDRAMSFILHLRAIQKLHKLSL